MKLIFTSVCKCQTSSSVCWARFLRCQSSIILFYYTTIYNQSSVGDNCLALLDKSMTLIWSFKMTKMMLCTSRMMRMQVLSQVGDGCTKTLELKVYWLYIINKSILNSPMIYFSYLQIDQYSICCFQIQMKSILFYFNP